MTELPWDWSDFNSLSDNGIIEFDENNIISKIDSNTIEFARVNSRLIQWFIKKREWKILLMDLRS